MRKLFSFILAITMAFMASAVAFAAEIECPDEGERTSTKFHDEEEYFRFKDSVERMSDTGEFEIYCNSYLDSDTFVANSNQITIEASCKLYNRNTGRHSTSSKGFTITVHKIGGSDLSPVLTGKLNGKSVSTKVNVEKGEQYYLTISSSSTLDAVLYIDGEGSVSPVTRVE